MPKYRISRRVREGLAGRYEEMILDIKDKKDVPEDAVQVADDCKPDRDWVMRPGTPGLDGEPARVTREA